MLSAALSAKPATGQRLAWSGLGLLAVFGVLYLAVGVARWDRFGCWYFGGDFIAFYSSSRLMLEGQGQNAYNLEMQRGLQQSLLQGIGSDCAHGMMPMEYFGAAIAPFLPLGLLPLLLAFYVWLGVSIAIAGFAFWRIARALQVSTWPLFLFGLGSPFLYLGLLVGQVHAILLLAMTEFVLALRRDNQRAAGLWLALLLVKPQFLPLLGLLLIWKRRWRTIWAFAMGGLAFLAATTWLVGFDGLWGWFELVLRLKDGGMTSDPGAIAMTNWRALGVDVANLFGLSSTPIIMFLTVGTVAVVSRSLRGRVWESMDFSERDSVLVTVTAAALLTGFDTHVHSDVLLIPPALLLIGTVLGGEGTALTAKLWLVDLFLWLPGILLPILTFVSANLSTGIQRTDYAILILMALIVFARSVVQAMSARVRTLWSTYTEDTPVGSS